MNEKINLQDLISLLSEKSGITKKEAEVFLREFFHTIDDGVFYDQFVKIKSLGTFKLVEVSDRESVNVTTGARVLIPSHYKINYIPDPRLAERINEPFALFESIDMQETPEEELISEPEAIREPISVLQEIPEEEPINEPETNREPIVEQTPVIQEAPKEELINEPETNREPIVEQIPVIQETPEEEPINETETARKIVVEQTPVMQQNLQANIPKALIEDFQRHEELQKMREANNEPKKKHRRKRGSFHFPWKWLAVLATIAGIVHLYLSTEKEEKKEIQSIMYSFSKPTNRPKDSIPVPSISIAKPKDTLQANENMLLVRPDTTPRIEEEKSIEKPEEKIVEQPVEQSNPEPPASTTAKKRTIHIGETLTIIAMEEYGNKIFWIYLYLENKNVIHNPNNVPVGTTIIIPPASKYGIDAKSSVSIRKAAEKKSEVLP